MRTPSSQSPWLPLCCSLVLHVLVVLGCWWLVQSEQRVPQAITACVLDTGKRLKLSAIFESEVPARRPTTISTKVEVPPSLDPSVMLAPTPEFNPPVEVTSPIAPNGIGSVGEDASAENGSPGGQGTRASNGTSFFQVGASGRSVVYVLDRSLSMGMNGAFGRARTELLQSLQQLPPHAQFQVLAYNHQEPHCLVAPERLLPAQPEVIGQTVQAIRDLTANGSTNHVNALRRALVLDPDVIYFVTDADDLTARDVQAISERNHHRTAIHVIEVVSGRTPRFDGPLVQLASNNRGTYRWVCVAQ